jgi:RND superfamily putative drug exporter
VIRSPNSRGCSPQVVEGLSHAGRIVTTAAALLAVNFFAFGTGGGTVIQMFGIGTGVAILMDATLVRGVLVPAGMQVLGRAAWVGAASTASAPRPVGLREAPGAQPIADGRRT